MHFASPPGEKCGLTLHLAGAVSSGSIRQLRFERPRDPRLGMVRIISPTLGGLSTDRWRVLGPGVDKDSARWERTRISCLGKFRLTVETGRSNNVGVTG